MFSSPLTVAGVVIAVLGWLWLLIGVGVNVDTGFGDFRVLNFHMTTLANNVIVLGYVLAFAGILGRGLERIVEGKAVAPAARGSSRAQVVPVDEEEIAEQLRRKLMERGLSN